MAQPDPACENWTINQLWREQQAWTGISLHIPSWKLEMPGIVTVSTERLVMGTMIVLWFNCVLRLLCYTCVMISVYCSTKSRSHELPMADWRWMPLHALPARQSPSLCYVKTIQCQIYQISRVERLTLNFLWNICMNLVRTCWTLWEDSSFLLLQCSQVLCKAQEVTVTSPVDVTAPSHCSFGWQGGCICFEEVHTLSQLPKRLPQSGYQPCNSVWRQVKL